MARFSEVVFTDRDYEIYLAKITNDDDYTPKTYYSVVVDGRVVYTGTVMRAAMEHMDAEVQNKIRSTQDYKRVPKSVPDHYGDW